VRQNGLSSDSQLFWNYSKQLYFGNQDRFFVEGDYILDFEGTVAQLIA
jgi:hypothetical protein